MSRSQRLVLAVGLAVILAGIWPASANRIDRLGQEEKPLNAGGGLDYPTSLALDPEGNVFVASCSGDRIQELLVADGYETSKTIEDVNFDWPTNIAVDMAGNLFFTQDDDNTIEEIPAAGGYVTARPLAAEQNHLRYPRSIALDEAADIFLIDDETKIAHEIMAPDYREIKTLANGVAFRFPGNLALDRGGNVFVADGHDLKEIMAESGYATARTIARAVFLYPNNRGIAVDREGNVFVASEHDGAVNEFLAADGYATVKLIGQKDQLRDVSGIAIDRDGNLFVSARSEPIKEILASDGYATIKPLSAGGEGSNGIALDHNGNLFTTNFFTAYSNNEGALQEVLAKDGYSTVVTLPVSRAKFGRSHGIAIDRTGNLFVNNEDNPFSSDTYSKLLPAGGYVEAKRLDINQGRPARLFGIAIGTSGDFFGWDYQTWALKRFSASDGYTQARTIDATARHDVRGFALDADNNLFVLFRNGYDALVEELFASDDYATARTLPGSADISLRWPEGLAVDRYGNVFVAADRAVFEISPANGYAEGWQLPTKADAFDNIHAIAVDARGNLFIADSEDNSVKEMPVSGGYAEVVRLAKGQDQHLYFPDPHYTSWRRFFYPAAISNNHPC